MWDWRSSSRCQRVDTGAAFEPEQLGGVAVRGDGMARRSRIACDIRIMWQIYCEHDVSVWHYIAGNRFLSCQVLSRRTKGNSMLGAIALESSRRTKWVGERYVAVRSEQIDCPRPPKRQSQRSAARLCWRLEHQAAGLAGRQSGCSIEYAICCAVGTLRFLSASASSGGK
jgi:hypothetical protein